MCIKKKGKKNYKGELYPKSYFSQVFLRSMTALQRKHIPNPKFSDPRAVLSGPRIYIADNFTNLEKKERGNKFR
jgi:hypothetical protein